MQQHGSNVLPAADPPPHSGWGQKVNIQYYQNTVRSQMQEHGSIYFAHKPLQQIRTWASKFICFRTLSCCIRNKRVSRMQKYGNKYFAPRPPDPWSGVKSSKFNFLRTWSCCISNLIESRMQQHCCKYFTLRPPLPPQYYHP